MTTDFDTGQRFGAYLLGKLIGRGGMGMVYSAEHVHLGRTVALKLLTPELSENEDFRARFLRESRLAAQLDHPSIVTVYDAGDVNGVLYIAMRFIRGTDLSQLLHQRGPPPPTEVIAILEQVASALDAAHENGLVHRDVKPANVMIEGDHCYLTDFGLTKRTTSTTRKLTMAGHFLGTVHYVAPEQIQGQDLDGRADVYALGCVLHECLTGSRPYPRDSEIAVLYAQLQDPPPRPTELRPDLPPEIDAVVARAMAKNPDGRYRTCGQMVAAARAVLAGSTAARTAPVVMPPPGSQAPAAPAPAPPSQGTQPLPAAEPSQAGTRPLPPLPLTGTRPSPGAPPPPAPAPRKRRFALPLALLAVLVAGGVVAAIVLSGGEEKPSGERPPSAGGGGGERKVAGEQFTVGDRPVGVLRNGSEIWVANSGDGTVTRLAEDGSTVGEIPVGAGPFALARNSDSMWVTNSEDDTVSRIDLDSGEAGDPIPVGDEPMFIAANDDNVFVANAGDDTVTALNPATGEPNGIAVPVGSRPQGIVTSGAAFFVANSGDGTVTRVLDQQVTDTFGVGSKPTELTMGDGNTIWVANSGDDTVSRIGADGDVKSIDVRGAPFAMAFDGGSAFVASRDSATVTQLDGSTGDPVGKPLPVPREPLGMTASDGAVLVTSAATDVLTRLEP